MAAQFDEDLDEFMRENAELKEQAGGLGLIGFRGLGFRGLGFRVWGLGFRV